MAETKNPRPKVRVKKELIPQSPYSGPRMMEELARTLREALGTGGKKKTDKKE